MDEVSRGLVIEKICRIISINLLGQSLITILLVIFREQRVDMRNLATQSVFIAGIDITTTLDIFLYIDQIEFDNTRNITINLIRWRTVLGGQFEEHT